MLQVWDLALQYEEASNDEAGHESLSGGIGVHAFLAAVRCAPAGAHPRLVGMRHGAPGAQAWPPATVSKPLCLRRRTDAVRRYIRLERTPPPPPLMADEHKESQSKMLYLIVERHWRVSARLPRDGARTSRDCPWEHLCLRLLYWTAVSFHLVRGS